MLKVSDDQLARELMHYLHQALLQTMTAEQSLRVKEGRTHPARSRVAAAMRARRLACIRK
ncbi:hypothetical protein ACXZ1M_11640 [Duganella sp. PWIR1]